MNQMKLKRLIDVAVGRDIADLVIKNCKIIDVYNHRIIEGDIAICQGKIAGIGDYDGKEEIDAKGKYASPGLIDGHIHIESSYVSPEELGSLLVPCGTTTILHSIAHDMLKVSPNVEPIMTLTFMSLAVIPEIKLTDMGLFDVGRFDFIGLEV